MLHGGLSGWILFSCRPASTLGCVTSEQTIKDRGVEALKIAARWPGADRTTIVTLATILAATGADLDGLGYFGALTTDQPDQALPLALAGYFGVRAGQDIPAALARLDEAASRDLGLPQYYRGLALAGLLPGAGHAAQAVADLEFVLQVRDQLPTPMMRAVHHGLAAAYAALGKNDLAVRAAADSGLPATLRGVRLEFSGFWANAADGFRFSSPRIVEPARAFRSRRGTTSPTSPSSARTTASWRSMRAPPGSESAPR